MQNAIKLIVNIPLTLTNERQAGRFDLPSVRSIMSNVNRLTLIVLTFGVNPYN